VERGATVVVGHQCEEVFLINTQARLK
jgi:hypothetical protein